MDFLDPKPPSTIKEIQARIERNAQEQFIIKTVPELLFWELGLEYIDTDTTEVKA